MSEVWITGAGAIGPHGAGMAALTAAVREPRGLFRPPPEEWAAYRGAGECVIAPVPPHVEDLLAAAQTPTTDRVTVMSLLAAAQAWQQAGLPEGETHERGGVYWGTGMGGASTTDSTYHRASHEKLPLRPTTVVRIMANAAAGHVAMQYKLEGPNQTFSVACSSSAMAAGEAMNAIRAGQIDLAVVGGCESMLLPVIASGWHALRVVALVPSDGTPVQGVSKPFSVGRKGLVIGEGAAAFVLESAEYARRRGATPLAVLAGYATNCDAHSMAHPRAQTQARAMRQAIASAGLAPSDIGNINAHATGTDAGDLEEVKALREVFGEQVPPVSATKSMHGHLLGAAGAMELAVCLVALRERLLPATINLTALDPRCGELDVVPNAPRASPDLNAILSNSFAFGGSNVSLVIRRPA